MKFKPGERVKFLNEKGGGIITGMAGKSSVIVKGDDGFEFPVPENALIKDQGDFLESSPEQGKTKPFISVVPEVIPVKQPAHSAEKFKLSEEVLFAIVPGKESGELECWLINDSSMDCYYVISLNTEGVQTLFDHGSLMSRNQVLVKSFVPGNLKSLHTFDFNFIFYSAENYKSVLPLNCRVLADPSSIYSGKSTTENVFFERKVFINSLINFTAKKASGSPSLLPEEKIKTPESGKPHQTSDELTEVDLHIEEITENISGLSNGEILTMQMARFKIALDTALIHKTRRIVFIHGVGNGKLKHTLRKALDDQYPDLRYQDASFKEYGYGATLVIIR